MIGKDWLCSDRILTCCMGRCDSQVRRNSPLLGLKNAELCMIGHEGRGVCVQSNSSNVLSGSQTVACGRGTVIRSQKK